MSVNAVEPGEAISSGTQFAAPPEVETVTLRRATLDDAAMLGVVGAATFLEAFTWALPGADIVEFCTKHHTAEAYARYLAKPDTRIMLAVTGEDAPVGYVMLCQPDFPAFDVQPEDIELKRIYLFSRYRAGGNAQRLMDAAVADARELGRTRLLLGTHAGNARAIAFYRRNGFSEVGTRTFVVGKQVCSDLIFGKTL
jgi:ribosomal protein S18 acetylase RimI-like enzyme